VRRSPYQTGNAVVGMSVARRGIRRRRVGNARPSSAIMNYVKAVLNPSTLGVRIPDEFAGPTSVFQLEQEYIVTANGANLLMALELGTLPHFMSSSPSSGSALPKGNQKSGSLLGDAGTNYLVGGSDSSIQPVYVGTSADLFTLLSLYKAIRLVSAGIKVQFAGTDANNNGVLSIAYLNREFFQNKEELFHYDTGFGNTAYARQAYLTYSAATTSPAVPAAVNYFGAVDYTSLGKSVRALPVNAFGPAKDGCCGRYVPLDSKDIEFRPLIKEAITNQSTSYNVSNAFAAGDPVYGKLYGSAPTVSSFNTQYSETAISGGSASRVCCDAGAANQYSNYGAFIVTGENLNTSANAVFVVKVTANYEGMVRDEALNLVSTIHSPAIAGGIAKAGKIYGKKWQVKVGSEHDQGH